MESVVDFVVGTSWVVTIASLYLAYRLYVLGRAGWFTRLTYAKALIYVALGIWYILTATQWLAFLAVQRVIFRTIISALIVLEIAKTNGIVDGFNHKK